MTTSPYDSLPSGNKDILPETAEKEYEKEYIEVEPERMETHIAPPPKPPVKTSPFESAPQYSHLNINNLCGVGEYLLPFEESLLVPDSMPDMQRALFAEGRVDLEPSGKASYSKDDFLSGKITVYVVYAPVPSSADSFVDVVKSTMDFKTDKCWEGSAGDNFRVSVSIKRIAAEMVNERKFTVKGELLIKITELSHKELKVFKSVDDDHFVASTDTINAADLIREITETTEISQEITLSGDQPSPIKILKETIGISEVHRQITSGKLVINGSIHSQILYLGETDDGSRKIASLSNKTDFTQFIVIDNNVDIDLMKICFGGDSLEITIENKDRFLLQGNVTSHIRVYENKSINTTADAYHKSRDIAFDVETGELNTITETISGEISSREVINLDEADKKPSDLICGSCHISSIAGHYEKGRIVIEGILPVILLAADDDGSPFNIEHHIPVRGTLEMPLASESHKIHVDADVKEFWFDAINSRQIEINTKLNITVWAVEETTFCTIENLRFAETGNAPRRTPMAIYVVGKNDTLWDVAKRYKTDIDSLAAMNGLDPQLPLPEGAKLFVAK